MKEQISETIMIFIVIILLSAVVFSIFNSQKDLVNSLRKNEIQTQQKFGIN